MKEADFKIGKECEIVAPLVGAWIEREEKVREAFGGKVAPLVGAWIERYPPNSFNHLCFVAPLVGAWIVFLIGKVGLFLMLLINIL